MRETEKRRHSKSSAPSGPADSDESPRAAKRDGKPATERHIPAALDPETALDPTENSRGRRRRLQDPLPLEEAPRRGDGRGSFQQQQKQQQSVIVSENEFVDVDAPAVPVNPTHVPRSGYYFQHDDRTGPPAGRHNKRREYDRDGRMEPRAKARYDDRPREVNSEYHGRRNERHQESSQVVSHTNTKAAEDAWSHDKFVESQVEDQKQSSATRHTVRREFREHPPVKTEKLEEEKGSDPEKRSEKRYTDNGDKRSEKRYPDMNLAQRERERYRDRGSDLERGRWMDSDSQRGRFNPRRTYNSRYTGDGERAGGRFDLSRRNLGSHMVVTDKWSHDRFEELNRTPTPKQEEDSIAQIEALLAA